ncbi:MAG: PBSX family phage terminase large subunit [Candidatus Fonsibacter sp.]
MAFKRTKSVDRILKLTKRKKVIQGGSSAGKTFAILAILIDRAIKNSDISISVVAESMPHLRRGALRDFLKIMKDTNRYIEEHFNRTNLIYTFSNGSYMEFFAADQPDKLKGARRDVLYCNEANHITYEAYLQLSIRTREDIYIDFNPTRRFWAHDEVLREDDAELLILTYKDNSALDNNTIQQFKINIEKAKTNDYWKNWCKVYIDGEIGSLEGVIFSNWSSLDIIPEEARLIGYGLDFGYSNDPTALIAVYKWNDTYILDEVLYQTGLTNNMIHSLFSQNNVSKSGEIWADSAEPKSIKDLKNYGWKIMPVSKGKDSIQYGIGLIQENKIYITSRSKNIIDEFQNYQWIKDKNDVNKNVPIDAYNHGIDAVRYLFMSKMGNKNQNKTPFYIGK